MGCKIAGIKACPADIFFNFIKLFIADSAVGGSYEFSGRPEYYPGDI
ncbi:MAG: hypothetical protein ACOC2K_04455 [Bacteroidota bacterium]